MPSELVAATRPRGLSNTPWGLVTWGSRRGIMPTDRCGVLELRFVQLLLVVLWHKVSINGLDQLEVFHKGYIRYYRVVQDVK
jgi:hypothetical protein